MLGHRVLFFSSFVVCACVCQAAVPCKEDGELSSGSRGRTEVSMCQTSSLETSEAIRGRSMQVGPSAPPVSLSLSLSLRRCFFRVCVGVLVSYPQSAVHPCLPPW